MKRAKLRKGVYILPNLFTSMSLFCGFFSVIKSLGGEFQLAAGAILLAGLFDFLDGQVARLTRSQSRFGIEYDSLADSASFGFAPSVLVYIWSLQHFERLGWVAAFLFFACGVLRLARYNVQSSNIEKHCFEGLPIPSGAYFLAGWVLFYENYLVDSAITSAWPTLIISVLAAVLMVSKVSYRSLKGINWKSRESFYTLVALLAMLTLVVLEPHLMIFVGISTYIAVGLIEASYRFWKRGRMVPPQINQAASVHPLTVIKNQQNQG